MIYSVKDALRNEGKQFEVLETINLEPIDLNGMISFPEPVKVEGRFYYNGASIEAKGTITFAYSTECDRCGEIYSKQMMIDFNEIFTNEATEDIESYPIVNAENIDFLPLVQDNILSSISISRLCSEDCKGICPYCGKNKNLTTCSCTPEDDNNPFAVLRGLID